MAARKKQARGAASANELKVDSRARTSFRLLVAAVFFAGVASLIYEVVWIRVLGLSLGSTAVAFSVMLTAFL